MLLAAYISPFSSECRSVAKRLDIRHGRTPEMSVNALQSVPSSSSLRRSIEEVPSPRSRAC